MCSLGWASARGTTHGGQPVAMVTASTHLNLGPR